MKIGLKSLLSLVVAGILLLHPLTIPDVALADGMVIRGEKDRWSYLAENSQQAIINYEDGWQKMILSVELESATDAVWLFPVPAEPGKVAIDVVTRPPTLEGEDVIKAAKSTLSDIRTFLINTQIYPMIVTSNVRFIGGEATWDMITRYQSLEKAGMVTEVITAKTGQALYQYLQKKNLRVEPGSIPVLDHYIGKEYTFVVSWISRPSTFPRGVFVTFPTPKLYYPLLLTSVYEIAPPVIIRIIGHTWSQPGNAGVRPYVQYFRGRYGSSRGELKRFYDGPTEKVKYTKISIPSLPGKQIVDDLWVSPGAPPNAFYFFVIDYAFFIQVMVLIVSSMLAGIIAGWILSADLRSRRGARKLALISLSNCFSIIGLLIIGFFITTRFALKGKDYVKFVGLFSVFFLVISLSIVGLLGVPL